MRLPATPTPPANWCFIWKWKHLKCREKRHLELGTFQMLKKTFLELELKLWSQEFPEEVTDGGLVSLVTQATKHQLPNHPNPPKRCRHPWHSERVQQVFNKCYANGWTNPFLPIWTRLSCRENHIGTSTGLWKNDSSFTKLHLVRHRRPLQQCIGPQWSQVLPCTGWDGKHWANHGGG